MAWPHGFFTYHKALTLALRCQYLNLIPSPLPVLLRTRSTALCSGQPGWAGTRKVKPSGFYWSKRQWVAVASAGPYASLHPTTLFFLQAGCPSCRPTNSVKAQRQLPALLLLLIFVNWPSFLELLQDMTSLFLLPLQQCKNTDSRQFKCNYLAAATNV